MNLLEMLLSSMTTQSSTDSVAKKTGLQGAAVRYVISLALPILIKYMTQNAGTQKGAASLATALEQHNSQKTVAEQVSLADEADGSKIISHILGNDEAAVVKGLAGQTGLSAKQVSSVLASVAPVLLSGLSAATQQNKKQGTDLSSLLGMFTGQSSSQTGSMGNLLGSLLGAATSSAASSTSQQTVALGQTAQSSSNALSSVLGSLLGGTQTTQTVQQDNSMNGAQLLSVLASMMK